MPGPIRAALVVREAPAAAPAASVPIPHLQPVPAAPPKDAAPGGVEIAFRLARQGLTTGNVPVKLSFIVLFFDVAWFRPWPELNLIGFVFTFVIGGLWARGEAHRYRRRCDARPARNTGRRRAPRVVQESGMALRLLRRPPPAT
ncbi:MAG TPA: hypothetical protein VML92_08305 [Steroidobacteraceae bacterium]|nr:hypothetical protein [Steroidobacteraceae bacterium]